MSVLKFSQISILIVLNLFLTLLENKVPQVYSSLVKTYCNSSLVKLNQKQKNFPKNMYIKNPKKKFLKSTTSEKKT